MPIYEYKCVDCEHQFESLQKISDAPIKKCPACGKGRVRKLVSAAAFHLKGTGWYVTDFRDKKPGNKKDNGSTVKATEKSDSDTPKADKTESKPPKEKSTDKKNTESTAKPATTKPD